MILFMMTTTSAMQASDPYQLQSHGASPPPTVPGMVSAETVARLGQERVQESQAEAYAQLRQRPSQLSHSSEVSTGPYGPAVTESRFPSDPRRPAARPSGAPAFTEEQFHRAWDPAYRGQVKFGTKKAEEAKPARQRPGGAFSGQGRTTGQLSRQDGERLFSTMLPHFQSPDIREEAKQLLMGMAGEFANIRTMEGLREVVRAVHESAIRVAHLEVDQALEEAAAAQRQQAHGQGQSSVTHEPYPTRSGDSAGYGYGD